jgi:hypothetical protein
MNSLRRLYAAFSVVLFRNKIPVLVQSVQGLRFFASLDILCHAEISGKRKKLFFRYLLEKYF